MVTVTVILLITGLCLGSFINALVWRLHELDLPVNKRAATAEELSIVRGRSMCPHCKHTLAVLDLLPVVSWLALRGRCRYCKQPIGRQYPLVELAMAGLFILSYLAWPHGFTAEGVFLLVVWLAAAVGLMALLVYDLRWMLLPNKIVFPLIGLGIIQILVQVLFFDSGLRLAVDALLSVAVAGGLFYVLFQLSDGKWIGGGDVKLGFALGLFIGQPALALLMLFLASLLGVIAALPAVITKRLGMASRIPFGPFLILATIVVVLWGQGIVDWYMTNILLLP